MEFPARPASALPPLSVKALTLFNHGDKWTVPPPPLVILILSATSHDASVRQLPRRHPTSSTNRAGGEAPRRTHGTPTPGDCAADVLRRPLNVTNYALHPARSSSEVLPDLGVATAVYPD